MEYPAIDFESVRILLSESESYEKILDHYFGEKATVIIREDALKLAHLEAQFLEIPVENREYDLLRKLRIALTFKTIVDFIPRMSESFKGLGAKEINDYFYSLIREDVKNEEYVRRIHQKRGTAFGKSLEKVLENHSYFNF